MLFHELVASGRCHIFIPHQEVVDLTWLAIFSGFELAWDLGILAVVFAAQKLIFFPHAAAGTDKAVTRSQAQAKPRCGGGLKQGLVVFVALGHFQPVNGGQPQGQGP